MCNPHEEYKNTENNFVSVEANPRWQSPTLGHLIVIECQLSASTPPAAAVNRTPGQLFGEGLQAAML